MQIKLKEGIIIALGLLVLIFFATTIKSCTLIKKLDSNLTNETSTRFDLEKKIEDFKKNQAVSEESSKDLTEQLNREKDAHQATQKLLTQEKLINESLKDDIKKLNRRNTELEEDVKKMKLSTKP